MNTEQNWHNLDVEDVLKKIASHKDGLSDKEATARFYLNLDNYAGYGLG